MSHAWVVARTARRERGVLGQFAVQPVRCVDAGGVGGVAPLRRRQEADRARWRIADGEREVARRGEPRWVVLWKSERLLGRGYRGQHHQELFQRRVVGDENLTERGEVRQQHRYGRLHLREKPRNLLCEAGSLLQDRTHLRVVLSDLLGHTRQTAGPSPNRVSGLGLRIQKRPTVIDQRLRLAGYLVQVIGDLGRRVEQ